MLFTLMDSIKDKQTEWFSNHGCCYSFLWSHLQIAAEKSSCVASTGGSICLSSEHKLLMRVNNQLTNQHYMKAKSTHRNILFFPIFEVCLLRRWVRVGFLEKGEKGGKEEKGTDLHSFTMQSSSVHLFNISQSDSLTVSYCTVHSCISQLQSCIVVWSVHIHSCIYTVAQLHIHSCIYTVV